LKLEKVATRVARVAMKEKMKKSLIAAVDGVLPF
jgi:hypothetical protein